MMGLFVACNLGRGYGQSMPQRMSGFRAVSMLRLQVVAGSLDAWMEEHHALLTFETSVLPESDPEKETLPDAVRMTHCPILIRLSSSTFSPS